MSPGVACRATHWCGHAPSPRRATVRPHPPPAPHTPRRSPRAPDRATRTGERPADHAGVWPRSPRRFPPETGQTRRTGTHLEDAPPSPRHRTGRSRTPAAAAPRGSCGRWTGASPPRVATSRCRPPHRAAPRHRRPGIRRSIAYGRRRRISTAAVGHRARARTPRPTTGSTGRPAPTEPDLCPGTRQPAHGDSATRAGTGSGRTHPSAAAGPGAMLHVGEIED